MCASDSRTTFILQRRLAPGSAALVKRAVSIVKSIGADVAQAWTTRSLLELPSAMSGATM